MGKVIKFSTLFLSMIFLLVSCSSGNYTISKDDQGKQVIDGLISWQDWQKYAGWESYDGHDYTPDTILVSILKDKLKDSDFTFYVFAGAWCGDSKSEVPKIFKLLNLLNVPQNKIILYGVDRQKQEHTGSAKIHEIEKVPTLLIYQKNSVKNFESIIEAGRIVEYPKTSWEADILNIISRIQK